MGSLVAITIAPEMNYVSVTRKGNAVSSKVY